MNILHGGMAASAALGVAAGLVLMPHEQGPAGPSGPQLIYADRSANTRRISPDIGPLLAAAAEASRYAVVYRPAAEPPSDYAAYEPPEPDYRPPLPEDLAAYAPLPVRTYPAPRDLPPLPAPHYPSLDGDILALPARADLEAQTALERGGESREIAIVNRQGRREIDHLAHRPDPGPALGEGGGERADIDRFAELDDAYGPHDPDVDDPRQAPARFQPVAQTRFDALDRSGGVTLSEHIQRTIGGGAG